MLRSYRPRLPRLLALAVPLALAACGAADDTLAPTAADVPPASADEAVAEAAQTTEPGLALATTGQRILFSSSRKGTFDLFKSDVQGNNLGPLTSFAKYEMEGAWSWDNQRIAMVRPRLDANNVSHPDIYLMNADGTGKRWALSAPTPYAIMHPTWSPDGTHLVVTVYLPGGAFLFKLKPTTNQLSYVTAAGQIVEGSEPSYDASGKYLAFLGSSGRYVNWIYNGLEYGAVSTQTTTISRPAISPDGKKIAFTKSVSGNADIYVWTSGLGTIKRLTTHASYDGLPTWSPDGSMIAFESARSGESQIWTMNAATGGNLIRITHTSTGETDPAWTH